MGYKYSKSGFENNTIYLIPLSGEPGDYGILYPEEFFKHLPEPEYYEKLKIKQYRDCPPLCMEELKKELVKILYNGIGENHKNLKQGFILGACLTFLGLSNLMLPDPLGLLDELLILTGGALFFSRAFKLKKSLPALEKNIPAIIEKIENLNPENDILCSELFHAIREIKIPNHIEGRPAFADNLAPRIEWFDNPPDLESLLLHGDVTEKDLKNLADGISRMLPVKKIEMLERKLSRLKKAGKSSFPVTKKLRSIRKEVCSDTGLSDTAFNVYSSFYSRVSEYCSTL